MQNTESLFVPPTPIDSPLSIPIYQYIDILIYAFVFLFFFAPTTTSANGGIKQVAEGKYLVNLSLAPIAPYVGEKQNMLIGFADIQGNLIQEDISADLSLRYQREPIFERKNLLAKNGVLPFEYTYEEPGLYELFVSFRLPQEPAHTYMPEDFMIDVKESRDTPSWTFAIPLIVGALLVGFLLGRCFPPCSSPPQPNGMY